VIYIVHWNEVPYLLRDQLPSGPIAVADAHVILNAEMYSRIRDREWPKVRIVPLAVRTEPLDGFPVELRDMTPESERGEHWRKPQLMRARSIYVDFSTIRTSPRDPAKQAVLLNMVESVRDLSDCGLRLTHGLQLRIFDDRRHDVDLEARAVAYYDEAQAGWLAELDELGVRHVAKRYRGRPRAFRCLRCRVDFGRTIREEEPLEESHCPVCNLSAAAAIAPPGAKWPPPV
jgi:hypothetical protein